MGKLIRILYSYLCSPAIEPLIICSLLRTLSIFTIISLKPLMSSIPTIWYLLNLWYKTDLGGPTWVIMKGLLSLFMNLIIVGMLGRHAESCVHSCKANDWVN